MMLIKKGAPATTRSLLWAMAVVFLLALCSRVAFIYAQGVKLPPDTADYIRLAENTRAYGAFSLDAGPPLTPSIRRAPLYPVFLAAFIGSDGVSVAWAIAVQVAMDSTVAALVLLLAHAALTTLRWALAAGLAYAIFPGAVYLSANMLSEPLFTALTVAGLILALYGLLQDRLMLTALGGVGFGLAILCRPISLPLPFLLVGVSLVAAPLLPRRWLHAALLITCTLLVTAPWIVRCARVSGRLVLVQGYTPALFYVATLDELNRQDQETLWPRFSAEDPYGRRLSAARTPQEVVEADRFGLRLALNNIRSNPKAYLASRARSVPYLFLTSFDSFTGLNKSFGQLSREGDLLRLAFKLSLLIAFSLVPILLGLVGLVSTRHNLAAAFCATVWVYTLLINLPMWVEYRYWFPAVPFLLVSAAVGAQLVTRRLTARRKAFASA